MHTYEQRHRGPHLNDKALFCGEPLLRLHDAVYESCWLLSRGYARHSVNQLVGDHYQFTQRQRLAISRVACSTVNSESRKTKCLPIESAQGRQLLIDGFNLLITVETAIAGGLLLRCCDGCIRDIAGVHGTYRQVHETRQAIESIGNALQCFAPVSVLWLLDKPVSNSGQLAMMVRDIAGSHHWNWQAVLLENPDQAMRDSDKIVITSDSAILDGQIQWMNLGAYLITHYFPEAWVLDFSDALYDPGATEYGATPYDDRNSTIDTSI